MTRDHQGYCPTFRTAANPRSARRRQQRRQHSPLVAPHDPDASPSAPEVRPAGDSSALRLFERRQRPLDHLVRCGKADAEIIGRVHDTARQDEHVAIGEAVPDSLSVALGP
jgi:hypothetical protein